jgi:DNA modification methylase
MNGSRAGLCITDPPYGVKMNWAHGKASRLNRITGRRQLEEARGSVMAGDRDTDVALRAIPLIFTNLDPEGAVYVTAGTDLMVDLYNWLRENEVHYGVGMFWRKDQDVVSWNRYHPGHENIIFCGRGSLPGGNNKRWFGPKNESTIWEIPIDARGHKIHRAQKPVALYERAMINSSAPGEIVVDPFAGSGPLIVAAEKHQRHAYMIELDPAYCDVIVKRWMALTGQKPTLA